MAHNGFAKRRDKNESEIIAALERVGCTVEQLNAKGVPDLLVGRAGRTHLLEVKGPDVKKHKLTTDQAVWFVAWKGDGVHVVRSIEDALRAVGLRVVSPGMYVECPGHDDCDLATCRASKFYGTYPRSKS